MMEGLRFVLGNRLLRAIAMTTGSGNLFGNIAFTMLLVLLADGLALPPGAIGLFLSISAAGGLGAALIARRVAAALGQGPTIWMVLAVTSPFGLLAPLAERGPLLWVAAFGMAVSWCGSVVYNITQVSFRQGLTPERLLGRMNATMRFLVWGTIPLGAFVSGVLGEWVGVRPAIWIGAIGGCLAFLPVFLSPLRTMRELPKEPEPESTVEDEAATLP